MRSDLVEILRCPAGHEPGYLVATVGAREGRYIRSGALACPRCRTEWEIRNLRADFGGHAAPPFESVRRPTDASLLRLAAQLDLRAAGGHVLLSAAWAAHAAPLAAAYDVHVVVLNAPGSVEPGEGTSFVDGAVTVPLAVATVRGAAVDDAFADSEQRMLALVAALRPGARVVAPAAQPTPDGLEVLARDEREWVAARKAAATTPIPISRAAR